MRAWVESKWVRSLLVAAAGASAALVVRATWDALHVPGNLALERSVIIGVAVAAAMFVGDTLRPDPHMRWPARIVYTAIGCLIAVWMLDALG